MCAITHISVVGKSIENAYTGALGHLAPPRREVPRHCARPRVELCAIGSVRYPSKRLQNVRDATLLDGSDFRDVQMKRLMRDGVDPDAVFVVDEIADDILPRVTLKPVSLLGFDVRALEIAIRPPFRAVPILLHGFCEKPVSITAQLINIDGSDFDRPEALTAGRILQVSVVIRGSDEDALARSDNLTPPV